MEAKNDLKALYAEHLATQCSRFDRALAQCGYRGALVHSGCPTPIFRDDQSHPFRAHAWFRAWVPLGDAPDSFLYYECDRPPILLIRQSGDFWHKAPKPFSAFWSSSLEPRQILNREAARDALPADLGSTAYIGEPFPELAAWGVAAVNPSDLMMRLDYDRARKTSYELACIRAANRIAARGHLAAVRAFEAGSCEFEIALAYLRAAATREHELPYNPIIALNKNGATLHYQMLERAPPPRIRSLLIDAGAEAHGYASDVTRTYSRTDDDFASLVERFDALQRALCASVHAGVDWRDFHLCAHRLVAEFLQEADITLCDAEEAVETGVSSVFLPHGVGHLLGLQVHDVGGLLRSPAGDEIPRPQGHPFLRLTRVLEPGFVVTVEPGVYFIEPLLEQARADQRASRINWRRVESLKSYGGIRIEDDIAVGVEAPENLTREAFRAAERQV